MGYRIFEIPQSEIKETLSTKGHILHKSDTGTCISYLKNVDNYYVFSITNPDNTIISKHVKLPIEFVKKYGMDHKDILDEFLKNVAVRMQPGNKLIMDFDTEKQMMHLNPYTFNASMPFGLERNKKLVFFFVINILNYKNFLEKYNIS